MSTLVRVYRLLNLLSLDVVAGAVVSALFFARVFQVEVRPVGLIALGLTVWIIYTADHLRDVSKIAGKASTERHRFHQVHYKKLMSLTIITLGLNVVVILFLKPQVLEWGVALSLVVFAYMIAQGSLKFLKEIFIAVLYTCGVLLLSVPVTNVKLNTVHYMLIVQFGVTALANLIMFSWFDREFDQQDKRHSFVTKTGEQATRLVIWFLLVLQLIMTLIQWIDGTLLLPSLIVGCMGICLLLIFIYRAQLEKNDYYRVLGDAVFFLPATYLLLR
jgi:4-hydroxybenzoate polyprenyltransferase